MWIHMCAWVTRLVHTCGLKHTDADMWMSHTTDTHMWTDAHKPIWINESSVNPKSISDQSSNPCTVLQYPSRKVCACDAHMWISHRCEWVTGVNESQEWMCHRCTGVNESQVWMSPRYTCDRCTHVSVTDALMWISHRYEQVTGVNESHAAQEASWERVFDPVYTLVFGVYHELRSELKYMSHLYPFAWVGVDIRWISVDGFDTRCIPSSFLCGWQANISHM